MKQIAIYGKGGIGKSTLSANLSASFAKLGKKTLQIGCDPKHDSTRLLLHGKRLTTVLDYIRQTNPLDYRLNHILETGYGGVGCIEAGGPEPGVGCAGRGIISVFELLEQFQIQSQYDLVVYDVLGDVVCGGFAVPIRRNYADTIFLVTSGEYMSIYAANNILRGIANYDKGAPRVAGILYNARNLDQENKRVEAFAKAVGLPIFGKIPRDEAFAKAERAHHTVVEQGENPQLVALFSQLASRILDQPPLFPAKPLDDETLESVVMGTVYTETETTTDAPEQGVTTPQFLSKNIVRNEPLHGCAFNGAMSMGVHVQDMAIIAHGPKSCGYLAYQSISSSGRRNLFERGALLPASLSPNLCSTDMNEHDMVFGGISKLEALVKQVQSQGNLHGAIIISTCPAGIIGDDIAEAKALATEDFPVVTVKAEGNLTGDYLQGMLFSYTEIAKQLIDPQIAPQDDLVNVIFEKVVTKNAQSNFEIISAYLRAMGIGVNCRFLCQTTQEDVKNFCKAKLNLLAYEDYTGKILKDFFVQNYGSQFYDQQFPVGFAQTKDWMEGIAQYFGKDCTQLVAEQTTHYQRYISRLRPKLTGKSLMVTAYNHDLDWILQVALDVGMTVCKIGVYNYSQDEGFRTALDLGDTVVVDGYSRADTVADLQHYQPDILLANYQTDLQGCDVLLDTIPMCPDVGFFAGIRLAERWADLLHTNQEGEWNHDKVLFDKFHTR
ncbi:nitrogenase component 1 [Bengtsoniella intestinalis]|uniref:nitrogenase component 1 n=1 Tax=Bengtsoniella intestinalis TaxID=3073143 RepID=UPI00391FB424